MTTAEAIEAMTDEGRFQHLAVNVLRQLYPECRALIHTGLNAAGKTIVSAMDGFCQVPGTVPPQYILTECTTTSLDKLREKWLLDMSEATTRTTGVDGDLVKSGREAAEIRAKQPTAGFVVYLCSNRVPGLQLQKDTHFKAEQLGVLVEIVDQSRMADHLDTDAEGQWLRQMFLGVQAERLSESLLREISLKNLNTYRSELLFLTTPVVPTKSLDAADAALRRASVCLLVGPSGVGKSINAYELLRRHIDAGGRGLWVSSHIAEAEASLASAVARTLREIHPRLSEGSGHAALGLAGTFSPFVIVVDDVCRSKEPLRLLEKLLGWARPFGQGTSSDPLALAASLRLVCPIWNTYWGSIEVNYRRQSWIADVPMTGMERPEAIMYLRRRLEAVQAPALQDSLDQIAASLRDDPMLLYLFCEMAIETPDRNFLGMAQNVIGEFIERALSRAVPPGALISLHSDLLTEIALNMIRQRNLRPSRRDVEKWFEGRAPDLDRIHRISEQGIVGRFETRPSGQCPLCQPDCDILCDRN
ncbi:MAG: hypothetical protein ABSA96_20650 [Candidatus Acidiferrales bacterium]